ncbi:unnamed protein product [Lupinus luteus]|uniref:Uncharacterized protein n=1 Tax=Lupinus luteus TaxID=3873 RepID=A0AAV1Y703_LUPLU
MVIGIFPQPRRDGNKSRGSDPQEELFLLLDERKSQTAEERGKRLMLLPIAGNETDSQAESEAVLSSAEIKAGKGRSSQVRLPTPWVVNHISSVSPRDPESIAKRKQPPLSKMSYEATIRSLSGGIERSLSLSEAREGREEVVGESAGRRTDVSSHRLPYPKKIFTSPRDQGSSSWLACQSMDGKETLAPVQYPRVFLNPKNRKRAGLTLVPSDKI